MANQAGGLRARVSSWRSWFPFLVYGPLVRLLGVLVIAMIALVIPLHAGLYVPVLATPLELLGETDDFPA